MPNIYYCQADNQGLGVLRAVLSWEQARSLVKMHPAIYVGKQFLSARQARTTDFALLRVLEMESNKEWQIGFYAFDVDISAVEAAIQAYAAAEIEIGVKRQSDLDPGISRPETLMEEPPLSSNPPEFRSRSKWTIQAVWRWLVAPWPNRISKRKEN